MLVAVFMALDWCLLSVTGRDHRARSPAMSAAHAAVLVGLVRLWLAHIGDRTRAEITGRDHLGRAEITGRDHLGQAEITRAEIVEGRDHRTPSTLYSIGILIALNDENTLLSLEWKKNLVSVAYSQVQTLAI